MPFRYRTTKADIAAALDQINHAAGAPPQYWPACDPTANVGNYHLRASETGVNLVRTINIDGGIHVVMHMGEATKREQHDKLRAFLFGFNAARATS